MIRVIVDNDDYMDNDQDYNQATGYACTSCPFMKGELCIEQTASQPVVYISYRPDYGYYYWRGQLDKSACRDRCLDIRQLSVSQLDELKLYPIASDGTLDGIESAVMAVIRSAGEIVACDFMLELLTISLAYRDGKAVSDITDSDFTVNDRQQTVNLKQVNIAERVLRLQTELESLLQSEADRIRPQSPSVD